MNRLFSWLIKNNYTYEVKACGGSYFYNAPGCHIEAAAVDIVGPDLNEVRARQNRLEKYINRYGYYILFDNRLSCDRFNNYNKSFLIVSVDGAAALEQFEIFHGAAAADCELLIHKYHIEGIYHSKHEELEQSLRGIMDYYGSLYNQSLIHPVGFNMSASVSAC